MKFILPLLLLGIFCLSGCPENVRGQVDYHATCEAACFETFKKENFSSIIEGKYVGASPEYFLICRCLEHIKDGEKEVIKNHGTIVRSINKGQ